MKMLTVAILSVVVLAACGGGDDDGAAVDTAKQHQAVNAVTFLQGDPVNPTVPIGTSYDCGIGILGATPVPARCLWTAVEQPPVWVVTFRETWACNQFAQTKQNFPDCTNITGFHEWTYNVDLASGAVDLTDETGQFPPDYVE